MKKLLLLCSLTLLVSLLMSDLYAQVTPKVSIQGILKSGDGAAVDDGSYGVTFKLYDAETGGALKWTEDATVDSRGGIYSHLLGSVTELTGAVFGTTVFLEVTVDGSTLTPRTELTYSPYTLSAASIASNGGSAVFDLDGNLVVAKDDAATANISADGDISADGNISADGDISAEGNISAVGDITVNNIITAGDISTVDFVTSGKIFAAPLAGESAPLHTITIGDADSGIKHKGDGHFALVSNGVEVLHIDGNNHSPRVSLFDANPEFPFYVGSYNPRDLDEFNTSGNWFSAGFADGEGVDDIEDNNNNEPINDVVAFFDGDVLTSSAFAAIGYYNFSDERIKKHIQKTDTEADLQMLNKIQIKDYEHIDQTRLGTVKKVIAQELKAVYPNAVSYNRNVIPNVYEKTNQVTFADGVLTITTVKAHDFIAGDKVDVFTPEDDYKMAEVLAVKDAHTFSIATELASTQALVYGKWVNDFHVVDYDAISMLNVSATQELYRLIQDLQKENIALKSENTSLKTTGASVESRLAKLEALLNVATTPTAVQSTSSK
ncbi:MAG: tail fiber domain-containing protein [Saprospiraceae bacterium]